MRTVTSAASSVASGDAPEQVFYDAKLRDAKHREVAAPVFAPGTRIADTHAHLDMLHHPELILARAAAHNVSFIVSVIDPTEDPAFTLNNLEHWQATANEWRMENGEWRIRNGESRITGEEHALSEQGVERGTSLWTPGEMSARPSILNSQFSILHSVEVALIVGCHPHNAAAYSPEVEELVVQALTTDVRVVGIGEVGLDYHYDHSPRDIQERVFRRQIQLAHEHGRTITLHLREAHADGLRILREEGVPRAGLLLHCFNLDYATLEPFLELGALVAFGGPLTFKKADEVRDAAARCPLDRIITETDCPFMAPVPVRGSVCEPASVVFVADTLRNLRPEPDALEQAYNNARRFFSA